MSTSESESFVRSFARGLDVIEAMGRGPHRQTLAQIANAVGIPRTAVRRFVMTLIDRGFVRTDEGVYWLTPRVLRLGLTYLTSLPYWRQAQPTLEELSASVKQSCALSVLDGEEIVYILRQHTKRILPMSPSLGSRLPAHAVSMGRVLLSGLDDEALDRYLEHASIRAFTPATVIDRAQLGLQIRRVRTQGWAWIQGELDESICGLAIAVRDQDGADVAAVNVSLPNGSYSKQEAVKLFLGPLRLAASQLRAANS